MKRVLSILICCILLFVLCACDRGVQLDTGPFQVTPISGFVFTEEENPIYVPGNEVTGQRLQIEEASLGIQAVEYHAGVITIYCDSESEIEDVDMGPIELSYGNTAIDRRGPKRWGRSWDGQRGEYYYQEELTFKEFPEQFDVTIHEKDGDETLDLTMVKAPVYESLKELESCVQTEYGAMTVFAATMGESVYFEPVFYGNEDSSYQLLEVKPYHMISYEDGLLLSEDPYVSLLDGEGNVILEEVPLTRTPRNNSFEMGNKYAYYVPKEVLEGYENVILRFTSVTVTSTERPSTGFHWGALEFTTPLEQGSVSFGELVEHEGDSEGIGVKLTFGECEDESMELLSISAKMMEEDTNKELGFSYYDSASGIMWFSHRPKENEKVIIEWYSPEYRWNHTLEVPLALE